MEPVLTSTLLLTLLLVVGLFFFIRASTKDRTETVELSAPMEVSSLREQLKAYFENRAYEVTALSADESEMTFRGVVQASVLLAIFLSALAALGLGCMILILYTLFPNIQPIILSVLLLSPLAGIFYWKGACRPETVTVTMSAMQASSLSHETQTHFSICAHRDEIATLKSQMNLNSLQAI